MNIQQSSIKSYAKNISSAILLSSLGANAFAQATFLIWPIYPNIESNEKATAIWLENTGKSDAMVQVRAFKWNQKDFKDDYEVQTEIIPSPPVAKIKAGEKYMLRITRSIVPTPNTEQAYRIIVDELPIKLSQDSAADNSTVSFQMRYSIPLFSYGKGIGSGLTADSAKENQKNMLAQPILTFWTEKNNNGQTELYIKNTGLKFARITGIRLNNNNDVLENNNLALGYVLANSSMRFSLSPEFAQKVSQAQLLYTTDSSGSGQKRIEIKRAEQ